MVFRRARMSSRVMRAAGRSRKTASLPSFHSVFQTFRPPSWHASARRARRPFLVEIVEGPVDFVDTRLNQRPQRAQGPALDQTGADGEGRAAVRPALSA